jgi:hypothetical protein
MPSEFWASRFSRALGTEPRMRYSILLSSYVVRVQVQYRTYSTGRLPVQEVSSWFYTHFSVLSRDQFYGSRRLLHLSQQFYTHFSVLAIRDQFYCTVLLPLSQNKCALWVICVSQNTSFLITRGHCANCRLK